MTDSQPRQGVCTFPSCRCEWSKRGEHCPRYGGTTKGELERDREHPTQGAVDLDSRQSTSFFGTSREKVLAALDVIGPTTCLYGAWPDGRCDCKYGVKTFPAGMGEQTGCPELRVLRSIVAAMTDDEWTLIQQRAGGVETKALFGAGPDLAERLLRADAAVSMAQANIATARDELTGKASA